MRIIIGTMGGGKGYHCVKTEVLAALELGRRIVTNFTLDIEALEKFTGRDDLDELIRIIPEDRPDRPFSLVSDFKADLDDKQMRPLILVDEAFTTAFGDGFFDRTKKKDGQIEVHDLVEWVTLHRRDGYDLVVMAQSLDLIGQKFRKLAVEIIECAPAPKMGKGYFCVSIYAKRMREANRQSTEIFKMDKKYFGLWKTDRNGAKSKQHFNYGRFMHYRYLYLIIIPVLYFGYLAMTSLYKGFTSATSVHLDKSKKPKKAIPAKAILPPQTQSLATLGSDILGAAASLNLPSKSTQTPQENVLKLDTLAGWGIGQYSCGPQLCTVKLLSPDGHLTSQSQAVRYGIDMQVYDVRGECEVRIQNQYGARRFDCRGTEIAVGARASGGTAISEPPAPPPRPNKRPAELTPLAVRK